MERSGKSEGAKSSLKKPRCLLKVIPAPHHVRDRLRQESGHLSESYNAGVQGRATKTEEP